MSLRYMGVPDFCKHFEYEDRCELCKRDREITELKEQIERLRASLKPFATFASRYLDDWPDRGPTHLQFLPTIAEWRSAQEALT